MKTKTFSRYSYAELREAALKPGAKQIDIDTLGAWFSVYGQCYWNGEVYDADGKSLRPVYSYDTETDVYNVVGYSFD